MVVITSGRCQILPSWTPAHVLLSIRRTYSHQPMHCLQNVRYNFSYGKINIYSTCHQQGELKHPPCCAHESTDRQQPHAGSLVTIQFPFLSLRRGPCSLKLSLKWYRVEMYPFENGRPHQGLSGSLPVSHISCVSGASDHYFMC